MDVIDCIKKRHSTHKFSSKQVKRKDVTTILNAGNKAPSAGNTQSWQFVVLNNKDLIAKVAEATVQPESFYNVGTVIMACSKTTGVVASYPVRGELYAAQNTAAATENMLLAATSLDIDSLWVGGLDEDQIRKILEIPNDIDIHALIILGYASETAKKVSKAYLAHKVFYNAWGEKSDGRSAFPLSKHLSKAKNAIKKAIGKKK